MVTKEQAAEFIKLMRQAVMSSENQTDDYAEPMARIFNKMTGEVVDDDIHLDCGKADENYTETVDKS